MNRIRTPGRTAVEKARAIVDALDLREPDEIDIALIAASQGVFGFARALEREEGHLLRAGDVGLATVSASLLDTTGWRWVLAHELAHKVCDRTADDFSRCTAAGLLAHQGVEKRANDFAGEVLMPERMFAPRWRAGAPTLGRVAELAGAFRVDLAAAALRGLLFAEAACAAVLERDGRVMWCAASVSGFGVKLAKGDAVPEASAVGVVEETARYQGGMLRWWVKAR